MTNIIECLNQAQSILAPNPFAREETLSLLGHLLQQPRTYLLAWPHAELESLQEQAFAKLLDRRVKGEPLAYILGKQAFWELEFKVSPDTLIPRPETERLVETVLQRFKAESYSHSSFKLADLGTGCGAIALSLAYECPNWQIFACDQSTAALCLAKENSQRLQLAVHFAQGNWCHALPCHDLDVIVSNPPYIAEEEWPRYAAGLQYEPRLALLSGHDGLTAIRDIIEQAKGYLKPGGWLFLEHGFEQGDAVRQLFAMHNYIHIETIKDFAGLERVSFANLG